MAARRPVNRRSRVIRVLKIGFPLIALGLLAAVFLLSERNGPDGGIVFSQADLEAMRSGMSLTGPQFSGASVGGDIYDFKAASVVPRDRDMEVADVDDLDGAVDYADGRRVRLAARAAVLDFAARQVRLDEGIALETSDGYTASADRVELDLRAGAVVASGNVSGEGPIGRIEAGSLTIRPAADNGENTVFRFGDGVRLRYLPAEASNE